MKRLLPVILLALPTIAFGAQNPPTPSTVKPTAETVLSDSPRAGFLQFRSFAGQGQWNEAAKFLELRNELVTSGALLAQRLQAILDHYAIDPNKISPNSEGQQNDGLPQGIDEIAQITIGRGSEPIRMVYKELPGGARWLFSQATVSRVNIWYTQLNDRWIRDHLPEPLLRTGPRGLLWWQWLAFPLLMGYGFLFGRVFSWSTRKVVGPFIVNQASWDVLVNRLNGPLTLLGALIGIRLLTPFLSLNQPSDIFVSQLLTAGLLVIFFWSILRTVSLAAQLIVQSTWAKTHSAALSLLPFGTRLTKVAALALAAIGVLSELGYPVTSLLAGLGVGGLALALAAQKTVENFLGSVSISVDQPFRVGDAVRIDGITGTVESIGMRSTRVRTAERTVVTFPNGKLADMRCESFGPRDRILFNNSVNLAFGSRASQVRQIVLAIEKLLKEHPKIHPADGPSVRLIEIGQTALRMEIQAWFANIPQNEYTLLRQELLFNILEIVEQAGAQVALPAQTVHLKNS